MPGTQGNTPLGVHDLSEDMFGLSVRGIKTVSHLFTQPKTVFEASRSADWSGGSYTPSIRLVFSILAVIAAIRFLWAGPDSYMSQSTFDQLMASPAINDPAIADLIRNEIMSAFLLMFPFTFMLAQILAALSLHIWGTGTKTTLRIRFYFLAITPSTLVTLIMLPLLSMIPLSFYWHYTVLMFVVTYLLDVLTSYRGAVVGSGRLTRLFKSCLLGLTALVASLVANTGGFAIASLFVSLKFATLTG